MVSIWKTLLILAVACSLVQGNKQLLRMVTWNVAENVKMNKEFEHSAMDSLLGFTVDWKSSQAADIYAVGLQEDCWNCATKKLSEIPKAFLNRLELKLKGQYEIIGIQATRESEKCDCLPKHGTTVLFVIAKKGVVKNRNLFNYITGCSDDMLGVINNDEKGVAYMRLELTNGRSVCLATNHLPSHEPKNRRECLKNFLIDAQKKVKWSGCDSKFISGDFNTRTAKEESELKILAGKKKGEVTILKEADIPKLKIHDEMIGPEAYGKDPKDPHTQKGFLEFINNVHLTTHEQTTYEESKFTFFPTFHLDMEKALPHHYMADRPISWTDRIIFSGAKNLQYHSIDLFKSDHLPVFGEFELP